MAKAITKTPAMKVKTKRAAPLRKRLDKIVADIDAEIEGAVQHALDAPLPDTDEIYKDVLEETA